MKTILLPMAMFWISVSPEVVAHVPAAVTTDQSKEKGLFRDFSGRTKVCGHMRDS